MIKDQRSSDIIWFVCYFVSGWSAITFDSQDIKVRIEPGALKIVLSTNQFLSAHPHFLLRAHSSALSLILDECKLVILKFLECILVVFYEL